MKNAMTPTFRRALLEWLAAEKRRIYKTFHDTRSLTPEHEAAADDFNAIIRVQKLARRIPRK